MPRAALALVVLVLAIAGVGCPCVRGAINASPEIRWWLFSSFGASQMCPEMLKRGVPLKLPAAGNASVGRFFPAQCNVQVDDARKVIVMTAAGSGYVTLPLTRRLGVYVTMAVEYAPDFRLEPSAMYVWGRFNRFITPPQMQIIGAENPVVSLATMTPLGDVATVIGNGIVASEIGKGFTVVRQDDGDDFALGHLDPPAKPQRQFQAGKDRFVLGSDLTEVRAASRDYLGPFEITDDGAALFLHARVQGAGATFAVVERSVGEMWRRSYEAAEPLRAAPGRVLAQGTLAPGEAKHAFALGRGAYYIVLENLAPAPFTALGAALPPSEPVAYVGYSVELGKVR